MNVNKSCFCTNDLHRIFGFLSTVEPQSQDQATEGSNAFEDDEGMTESVIK